MKTTRVIGLPLVMAGTLLLGACDQPSDATAEVAQPDRAAEQLLERCIGQARAQNYRSGQCAYNFIHACVTTQSREEMVSWLRVDQFGKIGSTYCPNSPDTYTAAFDRF